MGHLKVLFTKDLIHIEGCERKYRSTFPQEFPGGNELSLIHAICNNNLEVVESLLEMGKTVCPSVG